MSTVLDDSASEEAAVEADDPVGDVVGDFVDNHVMQMMSLDHFMKRDLSSFITPAYGDDVAVEVCILLNLSLFGEGGNLQIFF